MGLKSTFCCTRRISCSFYCTFTILLWSPWKPRPYINFPFSIRTQCWIDSGSWDHGGIFATRNRNHGNNGIPVLLKLQLVKLKCRFLQNQLTPVVAISFCTFSFTSTSTCTSTANQVPVYYNVANKYNIMTRQGNVRKWNQVK